MQLQASPEPSAVVATPGSPVTNGTAGGGNILTKEKLRQIVLAIQALRFRGATEQNSEEYAKLMQIMRFVTAQQQQQQQPQADAAAVITTEAQPKTPTSAHSNGGSASDAPTTPASVQAPDATPNSSAATVPDISAPMSPSAKAPQFSSDDVAQLRKQIQAFRLVSKNVPLPPQLRQELWASSISDEEKRLLDTPPTSLGTAAGSVVESAHAAHSAAAGAAVAADQPNGVQLVLPPLPQSVNFVSPHMLLKDKLAATGDQAARLQRLLVPSITPSGIDVRAMAQERERRCEARIEYRIQELAALPATVSDEQLDVGTAPGQEFMRPGLIHGAGSSARLKALIELKALGLRHKQRALRTEVVRSITRASQLGVAGDRTALRRMKKQSQREARLTEKMERQQRHERERREQDQHKQQLQAITDHGTNLVAWHKVQQQRMEKLGRAVQA
ncbi:ATP-dependent DNA helicase Snf21, partial [Coemansia sp. RSA 2611]